MSLFCEKSYLEKHSVHKGACREVNKEYLQTSVKCAIQSLTKEQEAVAQLLKKHSEINLNQKFITSSDFI